MSEFQLRSEYSLAGDQQQAVDSITQGIKRGDKSQVLLGVTGSGKTFTMANIIKNVGKPTLVLAHNKTLAAQLCNEFREFFPNNRVEFFVSYYDYYQPEAYIVASDTYIEKDMSINDEIDKLRHSATSSLLERDDVIVVSSVSCIYGLGEPEEYLKLHISLRQGDKVDRNDIIKRLIEIRYERNEIDFKRSTFRAKGPTEEIANERKAWAQKAIKPLIDTASKEFLGERTMAEPWLALEVLRKNLYEVNYEVASRPSMAYVPIMGLSELFNTPDNGGASMGIENDFDNAEGM